MRTGSHWNARFKGSREAEFAWFGHGAALPGVSMGVNRAAWQIVQAIRRGDAELTITLQAQAASLTSAIAPSLMSALLSLAAKCLPKTPGRDGAAAAEGWECRSRWMPTFLTRLGDRAAVRNNELRGHAPPA